MLHSTRGMHSTSREQEYIGSVNYMQSSAAAGWAHRCIGPNPGQHVILVPDDLQAGHATVLNPNWLSIEFAQGGWEPDAPLTDWQYQCGAHVIKEWAAAWHFPIIHIPYLGQITGGSGLVEHRDTAQGQSYGKSDIGPGLDWGRLLNEIAQA